MDAYEAGYRAKEGLRRIVREILISSTISGAVISAIALHNNGTEGSPWVLPFFFVVTGVPSGLAVWALYRILRFALGR